MKEYVFVFYGEDGKKYQINCNDAIFDYAAYRNILQEDICLKILNHIKEKSGKKIAIIFGNCQTFNLQDFFINNKTFSEKYFIVKVLAVWEYTNEILKKSFKEGFWSLCNLFISQRIKTANDYTPLIGTRRIASLLPDDSKIIWIPNVYFDGYFPQYVKNLRNFGTDMHQSGIFPHGDKYVDTYLDGGGGGRTPNFGTC